MIRYFEAFAGIGAFRSAFEKVGGFKCVGWCEIDRFAQKAYRALYDTGGEAFYEDITKIDYRGMPDFDLLVGGPCCQSFSVAGNRRAFEDDRGNLFFNYIEILEAKRPLCFIAENVPNLLGISQGECFRILLKNCRKHLISHLEGNIAWLHPEDAIKQRERLRAERIAARNMSCRVTDQNVEPVREVQEEVGIVSTQEEQAENEQEFGEQEETFELSM